MQNVAQQLVEQLRETHRLLTLSADLDRQFEIFFSLSVDIFVVIDHKDNKLVYVNPAWSRVLGWSEEETVGRPYTDFLGETDRAQTEAVWTESITKRKSAVKTFRNTYKTKDGRTALLEWAGSDPGDNFAYGTARFLSYVE